MPIIKNISATQLRTSKFPEFNPGDTLKVHQRIKEGEKERVQIFEGLVLAIKGGKGVNATFTVRKMSSGIGVERIYPLHSPNLVKIEIVKKGAVRSARLYYVRGKQDNTPRMRKAKIRQHLKDNAARVKK